MLPLKYVDLLERFIEGRNTRPPKPVEPVLGKTVSRFDYLKAMEDYYDAEYEWRCWDEETKFALVSIPDIVVLHHKPSGMTGVLTHIGGERIGIRDQTTGHECTDKYKKFLFCDAQDQPILVEAYEDRWGSPVLPGSIVLFAERPRGGLIVGRVSHYSSSSGTIMIDHLFDDGSVGRLKCASGYDCVVMAEDHPETISVRAEFLEIDMKAE